MAYTTIKKPSDYFNTVLYTGNGSTNAITGVDFQPDWVWMKARSEESNHMLFDIIRGTGKELHSQNTDVETTSATTLTSFDSDGFTLGSNGNLNRNTETYASWNWKANGAGSSNTDGSITSTVSANTTAGFSIVSYTGTGSNGTVGHGLGVVPKVIITKARTASGRFWGVYHASNGNTGSQPLNDTQAFDVSATYWQNTNPTSSVFSVGINGDSNSSSGMIAYCFADVQGYSKFGSYTGNGSTDGTFIYTGFKPALFIVKKSSASGTNWKIFDNKRATTFNPTQTPFNANDSSAEDDNSGYALDFLSNGIKLRNTNGNMQNSGDTHIYMAFAEEPLVGDNPATAR